MGYVLLNRGGGLENRIAFVVAAMAVLATTVGCGKAVVFRALPQAVDDPNRAMTWQGPYSMDLGVIDEEYPTSGGTPIASTFADQKLVADSEKAVWVGALNVNGSYRAFGRVYHPFSGGGSGWSAVGPQFGMIDAAGASLESVAVGLAPDGAALTVFGNSVDPNHFQSAVFGPADAWSFFLSAISGDRLFLVPDQAPASPGPVQTRHGSVVSVGWTPTGRAYVGMVDNAGEARTTYYDAFAGWAPASTATTLFSAREVEMLGDGIGATFVWRTMTNNLRAAWSEGAGFGAGFTGARAGEFLATGVQSFGAASDDQGNVVIVFVARDPAISESGCLEVPGASDDRLRCEYRLFAATRGASGVWTASSRLDGSITTTSTSYFQCSTRQNGALLAPNPPMQCSSPTLAYPTGVDRFELSTSIADVVTGGKFFATPQVVHLGAGRFLATFTLLESTSAPLVTGKIYSREYQVGQGWLPTVTEVYSYSPSTSSPVATAPLTPANVVYRPFNELKMVSDGAGGALLVAQGVTEGANAGPSSRDYEYLVFLYRDGAWLPELVRSTDFGVPVCRGSFVHCWTAKAEAALFASGEALVSLHAPPTSDPADRAKRRLFGLELRQ